MSYPYRWIKRKTDTEIVNSQRQYLGLTVKCCEQPLQIWRNPWEIMVVGFWENVLGLCHRRAITENQSWQPLPTNRLLLLPGAGLLREASGNHVWEATKEINHQEEYSGYCLRRPTFSELLASLYCMPPLRIKRSPCISKPSEECWSFIRGLNERR